MAAQQLFPGSRQAGHAAGLAVDVVGVVDDQAAEVLPQRDRQRERDDRFRLPHVEGVHLPGDDLRPGPRHAQVAQRLAGPTDRVAHAASQPSGATLRIVAGLGQARCRQPGEGLGLTDARDRMVVPLLGGGQSRAPAGDDGDVVPGLAQRDGGLPGTSVGHVGVVDQDGHARRRVPHGGPGPTGGPGRGGSHRRSGGQSRITIPR